MELNITLNPMNQQEIDMIRGVLDKLQGLKPGNGYVDVVNGESPAIPQSTPSVAPAPLAPITPTPVPPAAPPAAPVPTVAAPAYSLDQLVCAAAPLIDAGPAKIKQLQDLLAQFGVQSLQELPTEQYGAMANALRVLGAKL